MVTRASSPHKIIKLIDSGSAIVWRGDFHHGKDLLHNISREIKGRISSVSTRQRVNSLQEIFYSERRAQRDLHVHLSKILIPFGPGYKLSLPRSPNIREACEAAFGPTHTSILLPFREVIGAVGAHEWFRKGIFIPALSNTIHPHFGVFAPSGRKEYVDLLNKIKLPDRIDLALELGVGTGVLSAVLLKRGVKRIFATDISEKAITCARYNFSRLGYLDRVKLVQCEIYPSEVAMLELNRMDEDEGDSLSTNSRLSSDAPLADIIICNPPWLPIQADSILDTAVYDAESAMLTGFLDGLSRHLRPGSGMGLLLMSNLAELLGLRSPDDLLCRIHNAGLEIVGSLSALPSHKRAYDDSDPLHNARSKEVITLWSLKPR